jgi:hypothetical protein
MIIAALAPFPSMETIDIDFRSSSALRAEDRPITDLTGRGSRWMSESSRNSLGSTLSRQNGANSRADRHVWLSAVSKDAAFGRRTDQDAQSLHLRVPKLAPTR